MSHSLVEGVRLRLATAPSRVLFGPHVTNLADGRAISARHAAYYERRARGGCGVVVAEVASVHHSDWPYERAPLAEACAQGWADVASACHRHGGLALAGLGHAGMQGSTAWTQDVLWAPSLVPHVTTHEQPVAVTERELASLRRGFADAASAARGAGLDGVEVNAGQHSLLRQFCSGLTNHRDDAYGSDRSRLLAEVLGDVRAAVGDGIVGLRVCADELAPWAGLTPAASAGLLASVAPLADYVALERGSIYTEAMTRPDGHEPQGFNAAAAREVGDAVRGAGALLVLQGSLVDPELAQALLDDGTCDLVEMTRAQIADPDLVTKVRRGERHRVRPCLLCNQHCTVRDVRNPIVSCCVNPVAGHELDDAALDVDDVAALAPDGRRAAVVGGGVAGMEAARLLARRGHRVTLFERTEVLGGALRAAALLPGRGRLGALGEWLEAELGREGVVVERGREPARGDLDAATVVVATGARPPLLELRDGDDGSVTVLDVAAIAGGPARAGAVVVLDPVGGPEGVAAAELAATWGGPTVLVTTDLVAGAQLSLTGDLVAANARLAALGVRVVPHARAVRIAAGSVLVEDLFTAELEELPAEVCVDAGFRRPHADAADPRAVGDAAAPRGILMAMLEARRAALGEATR